MLCHLLMQQMVKQKGKTVSVLFTPEFMAAVEKRQLVLYEKLAMANDKLMGKA